MMTRNLGRTIVLIAVLGLILCLGWWAIYYNEVIRPLAGKGALTHPMGCLLWTAEACTQSAVKLQGLTVQPYMPLALWISAAVLLLGLVLTYVSTSTQPYPVTPVGEPKLFIGKLEPFYAWVRDLSWPIIRIAVGGTLLVHGVNKVMNTDPVAYAAKSMATRGLEPALPLTYFIYFLETGGAVMIILGLFTRLIAPVLAIQFFIITFLAHFPNGFGWTNPRGGWEFPLMWGLMFFAIALRGGGPYSLDRLLRREL
jgi:putative oxidoreductase